MFKTAFVTKSSNKHIQVMEIATKISSLIKSRYRVQSVRAVYKEVCARGNNRFQGVVLQSSVTARQKYQGIL